MFRNQILTTPPRFPPGGVDVERREAAAEGGGAWRGGREQRDHVTHARPTTRCPRDHAGRPGSARPRTGAHFFKP